MRIGKRTMEDLTKRWAAGAGNDGPVPRDTIWDEDLPGFGVRRQKVVARAASFVLKYRVKGDKRQRFVTLGEWPAVHPDAARDAAQAIKQAAALGRDLLAERQREADEAARAEEERRRAAIPLPDLLDAWRASVEASIARKAQAGQSSAYEREMLRLEAKHVRPFLAGDTVGAFDPDRLQVLIDRTSGRSAAYQLRNVFSRIARFARAWLLERGIKANWIRVYEIPQEKVTPRDHRYTMVEAAQIWIAAGALGRRGALVRFMLLTACRRSEAQRLRHEHLHLDDLVLGPHWEMEAGMVKHRRMTRVPLTSPGVALLRWLPPRETRRSGEADLVFAGRGNRPIGNWTDIRRALLAGSRIEEGTLHDIRRTVVSTLADHGWEPAVVDRLLNHAASATMPGVMRVYQRSEQWEQKRAALVAWMDLLMDEVGKLQGRPVDRDTWGFDQPFAEARIKRLGAKRKPAKRRGQAARGGRLPSPAGLIDAVSQASRSSGA
ncbi:site-specific integrase [Falsiroseomonas sp.]|uniref:site-specific integrase n=1 Tax=Falsiroseomonas sp. TaxID=2870721 RepID=UPI0027375EFE|nr:tyrosine-type recombinase/integrase [Falsiroseomonas sp.]MDP3417906.1 tyrosine-type recombinase/integrase [Falsiroseomonas sp.]